MKNWITLMLLIVTSFSALAQTGQVQGLITDENKITIPGASVLIEQLNKGAVSDFNGKFTLVNVEAGTYTLVIKYLGYSEYSQEITVSPKQTTNLNIVLTEQATELDEVQVVSFGFGSQARALNTQKNKQNITNIVSTDQIGKFPDANIGDAVKRIPGITMQVDQGEARNIIVRGLAPQLNSVTLNGSRIPSAEGDNRNVQMDLIPSDMIQSVEVNKAVTPDMDADAIGGSVNLITRTSPQGFRFSATGGSGINLINDKRILNGSFLLGDRSKNNKFGWVVSASYNDSQFGSDDVEAEWDDEFEYNTGEQDSEGEDILQELEVNPYANISEIREYQIQRVRRSFSANFDYKLNDNNTLYFKSIYNWRDDRENRFRLEQEILDGEDIFSGDFNVDADGNLTAFPVEAKRQTKGGIDNDRSKNTRLEDQRMQNYSIGGEHLVNNLQVDWMASYSKASEERLNERYLEYESEYGVTFNNNTNKPNFTPIDTDESDFSLYEFGELSEENQYTDETDFNALVNFEVPLHLLDEENGTLKFGAKTRLKSKTRDNDFTEFSPENDDLEFLGNIPTKDYTRSDYSAGSQYQLGYFGTPEYLGNLDLYDADLFESEDKPDEYATANYDVKENVYAAYVMTNQNITDKLSFLFGLRLEHTDVDATGNEIVFDTEGDYLGTSPVTSKNNYTNLLPGLHVKYDVTDNTVLRFAWTNTIARPNYVDIVPFREINNEDEEIVLGNPDLDPTTSMNFDIMAEHYFSSVGLLSGGVFYKDIQDFIYTYQFEDTDGYEVYQPFNGDEASVFGFEAAFQRQLDFLPGFLKNLNIYLNYTYLKSDASGIRNEDGEERNDLDLPNTAPNMFNGSLGYTNKYFSLRLSANYSDAYIDEIGGRAFEDRYYDEQFFLDFNARANLTKQLSLYVDVNNITNQPLRYYQGVSSRTMQMEYYKTRITFGLKYDLFKK
ncbi:TonB-dependent receptor [Formosa algae]|uniref:TonB-dependent receptor n=1 Tax=Formosa algae TaxID=225843 RepID=A0A9X0YNK8_9FLAO|nr:TonB-dependent receptor [Formosa algae]MBP1840276.1 TonB-dependent receptor [Formosa algae]MDQ0334140.1 TonB-dependent receptor [Formosa algae]OEI79465.1 TonB-dependent receptor [Formosa algae]